jgi:hypothetical protein
MKTHSAAYCTWKLAGLEPQLLGGSPPAVFSLYTDTRFPVAPFIVKSCNHATDPYPLLPWPAGDPAGAVIFAFFEHAASPSCMIDVSSVKNGVAASARKKWKPETSRFQGVGADGSSLSETLNCSAKLGNTESRVGFDAAMQLAL